MTQQTGTRSSTTRRWRRILAVVLGATLLLAACASSDGGGADRIGGGDSVTESATDAPPEFIDPSDPDIARAIELADQLVGELGDDDTAAEALLTAFAAGYSSPQVLDAVETDALLADGTVSGVEPAGPPLDLDGVEPKGRRPSAGGDTDELLPIERLRETADRMGGDNDDNVGSAATIVIVVLAAHGLTAEEIIQVLVLGEAEYTRDGVCYRKVIDQFPERCDARSSDDPAPAETTAPDPTTASESPSAAPESEESDLIDGTYTGEFDFESYEGSEALENNITVVIEGGAVASFDATLLRSFPYFEAATHTSCPQNHSETMVAVPGSITAATFDIEITDVVTSPAFADCYGNEADTQTFVATLTIATTDEGATVSSLDTDFTLELTRS